MRKLFYKNIIHNDIKCSNKQHGNCLNKHQLLLKKDTMVKWDETMRKIRREIPVTLSFFFCKNGHVFCKNTILKKCSISTFLKFLFVWSLRIFLTCSWHFIYILFFRGSPTKKNLLFIFSENLYFKLLKPLATFLACSYLKNKKGWYKVSLKCCRYARIRS